MTNVVDLTDFRPHQAGPAKCECGHRWMAVAPVQAVALECPACGQMVGRFIDMPTRLTERQKLEALAWRFYQDMTWTPAAGDYYTTSRADLELYQVVDVKGGKVFTRYCEGSVSISEWDADTFTTAGFGTCRVHVPHHVLGL